MQSNDVEINQSERRKRVLVVDNQPSHVQLMQKHLEAAGYEVLTAADGEDALKLIKAIHPCVIVTYDMMPKMDGFELLLTLKQDVRRKTIPFIVMTCFQQNVDVVKHFQDGFRDGLIYYIIKPFDPLELVSLVDKVLDAKTEVE